MRRTIEEERSRYLQDAGDVLQAARPNAVHAILVVLHLLEGKAKFIGDIPLTHVQHEPAHAYLIADVLIDWVR